MAGISWQCPRGSESGPDAEIPHARSRVCTDIDHAIARIPALAVDVRIETRGARDREQVLARYVYPGRRGPAAQHARRQFIADRAGLEPGLRSVSYDRAVPMQVGDFVLARRAGGLVREVARGARVALLPQAGDLVAVDRAERLAHPHQVHVARVKEVARPRGHGELRDRHGLSRGVRPGPEIEHLVAVV